MQTSSAQQGGMRLAVLRIENLTTDLIGPVSLEIPAGNCVALVGASGAGKSLLLRAIVDLDPNTGDVSFGAHVRNDMSARSWRETVALVPAESGWWADRVSDHFTSVETLELLLQEVGLPEALAWDVSRLSSGERQRLAVVRALCRNPKVLLLDEPTASLDQIATEKIEDVIRRCCNSKMAVLLVTHDSKQAARLATEIVRMTDGKIEKSAGVVA